MIPIMLRGLSMTWRARLCTIPVLLPLALPPLLLLLWHATNRAWPNDDAANYMRTAYEIFLTFRDHGFTDGLSAILNHRGWRPIFFPVLGVPFLALFGGNPAAAAGAVLWALYFTLEVYVYNLSRLFLSPIRAVCCTLVIVTLPVIVQFATVFFSELAWLCFSCMWLYHIVRSNDFRASDHSSFAGLSLGLMIATRPIESLVITVIPIAYFVGRAIRNHAIRFTDVLLSISLTIVSGGALILSLSRPALSRAWLLLICATASVCCGALFMRWRRSLSMGYLLFAGTVSLISAFWWAGFVRPLYEWAYTTSFGYMARVTAPPKHADASIPAMMAEIFAYYGGLQMWSIVGLAGLAVLLVKRSQYYKKVGAETTSDALITGDKINGGFHNHLQSLIITALGSLAPIFALYWTSGTGDPRRAMVGMVILLLAASIVTLQTPGPLVKCRLAFVGGVALLQICLFLSAFGLQMSRIPLVAWCGSTLRAPFSGRDANDIVSELLSSKLPKGSLVAVYAMTLHSFRDRMYEPAALALGAQMHGGSVIVGYLWDERNYDKGIQRLAHDGYRFLLLDTWDDPAVRQSHMPYVHFTAALLDIWRMYEGRPRGLQPLDTFTLGGRTHYLFEIKVPETHPVSISSAPFSLKQNIGGRNRGARAIATNHQIGYDTAFLNDDTPAPWGSAEGMDDSYAAVVLPQPRSIETLRIVLFSPEHRPHLRDISLVAADVEDGAGQKWSIVRSRIQGSGAFAEKITIPPLEDGASIIIEIDPSDRNARPHKIWGIACLSGSRGYRRNYLTVGSGVYVRELQILSKAVTAPRQTR